MKLNALTLALLATSTVAQAQQEEEHEHLNEYEVIVINASPLDKTALESAQPVNIISGDALKQLHAHSLGETLALEPGINNTHFANVAGSPIIRGLGGPRVKITQNGLDTGDVSRGSPDHAVTTETSTAKQIEVLRGPATLLYGSGAIGGVINVVDNRIPSEPVYGLQGNANASLSNNNDNKEGSYDLQIGNGKWALYTDAFIRRADDYETPSFMNDEGEVVDHVENTFVDAEGGTVGGSYQFDDGFFGVSYQGLYQEYGIPGHAHGEEEHEDEHGEEENHVEESGPYAHLEQERIQLAGQWRNPFSGFNRLDFRGALTDYQHQEIEENFVSTQFENKQKEIRLIGQHKEIAGWEGAVGWQWDISDKAAFGEEAFTPNTSRRTQGLFWVVEQEFGAHHVDLGVRHERTSLSSDEQKLDTFDATSASAGYLYHFSDHTSVSFNLSHAERAPAANEVFANGNHFATRTYELGLAYELHEEEGGEYHIEASDTAVSTETSNNIDVGFHYENDSFHANANVFYNRVDDFIYDDFTGLNSEQIHGDEGHDEHEGEHEHEHEEALQVVQFSQVDAELYGYELELDWQLNDQWSVHGFSDYTRAKQRDGDNLPRIPAQRVGTELRYQAVSWDGSLGYTRYLEQDKTALNETTTDAYGLLNASVNLYPDWLANYGATLYLKGENLTNQLGFVHSSFLKEDAPVTGRRFQAGVSISF
ncbi:TonB-dependent receptor domain-containing protein [Idiomarina abyssalis]|uniref:TonB-dependent receptor domain-containing protein n=1 Tax=Idiomarina abyssalis TaxID=86102 RepID=UPI0006C8AEFE|nr:TonB-dependent receptor [Idiomarina abyssalis]KPD22233.1 membrane protein [Idiomarina abyssalis]SFT36884.1 iron complex outermembrane recepter protein [Idiomarina abyssalis]